jgi:mannan polymerase II complex MNN11 subunit
MHSALPVTHGDSSGYYPSSSSSKTKSKFKQVFNRVKIALLYNSKVQYLLGAFILTVFFFNFFLTSTGPNALSASTNKKGATDEFTISYVSEPYIYPDLNQIDEYRKKRTIKDPKDGRMLDSTRHRILYKPSKSAAKLFNAPKYLDNILKAGAGELKDANPPLVLVLGLDADRYSKDYLANVLADRLAYAKKHNYGLYARYLTDFAPDEQNDPEIEIKLDPLEWAKTNLMREAMAAFDKAAWMWWLEQDAVIMDPNFDIGADFVFNKAELSKQIIRDAPIIPPESIIHTYKHVPADQVKFITTQNDVGISMSSYLIRNDALYGRMLLDYLHDPLHRKYPGFRSAGSGQAVNAAVTHLVQWHPAILSRMALVPAVILGAQPDESKILKGTSYKKGGFVYRLKSSLLDYRGVRDNDYIADEWKSVKAAAPSNDGHAAVLAALIATKAKPVKPVSVKPGTAKPVAAAAKPVAGAAAGGAAGAIPDVGAVGAAGAAGVAAGVGAARAAAGAIPDVGAVGAGAVGAAAGAAAAGAAAANPVV